MHLRKGWFTLVLIELVHLIALGRLTLGFTMLQTHSSTSAPRGLSVSAPLSQKDRASMFLLVPSQVIMNAQTNRAVALEAGECNKTSEFPSPVNQNFVGRIKEMTPHTQKQGFDARCTVVTANGALAAGVGRALSKQQAKQQAARSTIGNLSAAAASEGLSSAQRNAAPAASSDSALPAALATISSLLSSPLLPLRPSCLLPSPPPAIRPRPEAGGRLRGRRPNVGWRAISMATLRAHPLFVPLPPPEELELNRLGDCQRLRQV
jgi:hypothetical protein